MPNIAVITDSTAGVPEAMMRELHINTVAYYIHRGQEVLRDLLTIQRDEFLRWLTTAKSAPTTAAPGAGEYLEAYEKLASEGTEQIISIHMSSKISGAYQAASVAKQMLKNLRPNMRVEVIELA